jgi:hypothetical protein
LPLRPSLAPLLAALVALGACSAAPFDGSVYRGEGYAFRVPAQPKSWETLSISDADLAFRDRSSDATIAVDGRCGKDGEDVPLRSLTQHLFMQFTDREIVKEETVPFDGREALHTEAMARLDGVPMRFDIWVLKKDGCVYDLYYFASPDRFQGGVGEFRRFVGGFGTVSRDDS